MSDQGGSEPDLAGAEAPAVIDEDTGITLDDEQPVGPGIEDLDVVEGQEAAPAVDEDDDDGDQDTDDDDDDIVDPNHVPAANARSVLEYLVRSVVDDPDAVTISVSEGRTTTSLDVRVGDGDMGRVIGKRGRIAQAIRTVVRAAAVQDGVAVDVEFVD